MRDVFLLSLFNLFRQKTRTWLTMLGIAVGIGAVIVIGTVGRLGEQAVQSEIDSFGVGSLMVSARKVLGGTVITDEDAAAIGGVEGVEKTTPIMTLATAFSFREGIKECMLWGIGEGKDQIISLSILHGRLFNAADLEQRRDVCLIDENLAQAYYERSNICGKVLRVYIGGSYRELRVVGVVQSESGIMNSVVTEISPGFIYLPHSTIRHYTGKEGFDQVAVQVSASHDAEVVGQQITALMTSAAGRSGVYQVSNIAGQKQKLSDILDIVATALSAIAGISLVVAGLNIMTVMLVSVNERTREIGIKKSIGASQSAILLEFLLESALLALLGCLSGIVFGGLISAVGCGILGQRFAFTFRQMIFYLVFSAMLGGLFGAYPALRAARMKPVDALRFE